MLFRRGGQRPEFGEPRVIGREKAFLPVQDRRIRRRGVVVAVTAPDFKSTRVERSRAGKSTSNDSYRSRETTSSRSLRRSTPPQGRAHGLGDALLIASDKPQRVAVDVQGAADPLADGVVGRACFATALSPLPVVPDRHRQVEGEVVVEERGLPVD